MKHTIALIAAILLAPLTAVATPSSEQADFFVSPHGRDTWSGTLAQPNESGTDGPFASLQKARDAVRALKDKERRDLLVSIRGGEYLLRETVVFGPEDSQRQGFTVCYSAYPGEEPVFSAGVPVRDWKKLESAPAALPEQARGKVWVADIPALPGGSKRFHTLYDGMKRLPRARSKAFGPCAAQPADKGGPVSLSEAEKRRTIHFPKGTLRNWPNLGDIELFLFPRVYTMNYLPLEAVDEEMAVARTSIPASYPLVPIGGVHQFDALGGGSCVVENVIDFLDKPGAWVVDTQQGKIYLWPLADKPGDIRIPALREMLRVEGGESGQIVRNLVFGGLTFCHGDRDVWGLGDKGLQHDWEMWDKANALVRFRNAERCALQQCRLTMSGGAGVRLDLHCQDITVRDNLIEHLGGTGVVLCGYGPGTKDVNKHNRVINNHLHHTGEIFHQSVGIIVWASGENEIRNNLLHHLPYIAIVLSGVRAMHFNHREPERELDGTIRHDELEPAAHFQKPGGREGINRQWMFTLPYQHTRRNAVADNEIFQVQQTLNDGNAIYLSDVGTENEIRRNFIHHLNGRGWNQAIRTDPLVKDTLITQNVIHNVVGGGINPKNYNNHVINNIISDIRDIVRPGENGGSDRFYFGFLSLLQVWPRERLPARASTTIERNIFYKTNPLQTFYRQSRQNGQLVEFNLQECHIDRNVYYAENEKDQGRSSLDRYRSLGLDLHSIVADPGFVDLRRGDFRLKADSPALQIGFEPIDLSATGLLPSFPNRLRQHVEHELGKDYRSFTALEDLCRRVEPTRARLKDVEGL